MFIDIDIDVMENFIYKKLDNLNYMRENAYNLESTKDIEDTISNTKNLLHNDGVHYAYLFLGGKL